MASMLRRAPTPRFSIRAFPSGPRGFGGDPGGLSGLRTPWRPYFVCFQPTPNEACYKFDVEGVLFRPAGSPTLRFDRASDYQSPLARAILAALPMVEEVTVGASFVTVKRVEPANAAAAARYFAMHFNGTMPGGFGPREAPNPVQAGNEEESFELGGVRLAPADDELDEDAIRTWIEATCWAELKLHVCALITDHLYSGEPHVAPDAPHPHLDTLPQDGDGEVVLMIKELIATTIRPQLQKDGGDIRFIRFDEPTGGMVVELLGACRTCRSGPTALVELIERTTFHWIPEVKAVSEIGREPTAFERFYEAPDEDQDGAPSTSLPIALDQVKVPVLRRQPPLAPDLAKQKVAV
ncbi:unnamed protein product [Phytomonas sp. Hart1]|nr:unnamed protein product [Phytomonas sp. Hart1]|eukprot:CCW66157.1 unnamed protein product [Phytomonas sp. isolate Hart1]